MSELQHLNLDHVIFIGRTFDEYIRMFNLRQEELRGIRILDCPGGPCSFAAKASAFGADVTAVDVVYGTQSGLLREKGLADVSTLKTGMTKASEGYLWNEFGTVEGLFATRYQALSEFLQDYESHPTRYIQGTLPNLPFGDDTFDMVLSAHFLFTYAEQFDLDFHLQTLLELLRVSRFEVRIFPLISNGGKRQPYFIELKEELQARGYEVNVQDVSYHFQRGANQMLHILRKS